MVHFLRKNNQTIIECEVIGNEDLHSFVRIKKYSEYLLTIPFIADQRIFYQSIDELSHIRSSYFERPNPVSITDIETFVAALYKQGATELNLEYVTD